MAGIEDVARRAGVSPITVSRVVRNYPNVRTTTRERVQRAITELNYIPNGLARGLKQSRSGLIALLINDIYSPFYTPVARGAEDVARAAGMSTILGNTDEDAEVEAEYLRVMGEHRVDGVILSPTNRAAASIKKYLPRGLPFVLFDRLISGISADVVRCDTMKGTYELCEHILALGHRRIAIVGGLPHVPTWSERVAGYEAALRDNGLQTAPDLIVPGDFTRECGAAYVRKQIAEKNMPDAIIAANAQVALGVLSMLAAQRLRVPDDVAIAAIDDPLPSVPFWPTLTVVQQPTYDMGRKAMEMLIAQISHAGDGRAPSEIVFDAALRIGTSCGEVEGPNHARAP